MPHSLKQFRILFFILLFLIMVGCVPKEEQQDEATENQLSQQDELVSGDEQSDGQQGMEQGDQQNSDDDQEETVVVIEPVPEPEPTPEPEPIPDPTPEPEPVPDPTPVPAPDPEPTPDPTPEPEPTSEPEPEPVVIKLSGRVVDQTGLADVTVSTLGMETVTDSNGFYELKGLDVSDLEKIHISFQKDGYTDNQKIIPIGAARLSYGVNAVLNPYHFVAWLDASSDTTETIGIADPIDAANKNLVQVSFPSGAIPATGQIKISITRGDPTGDDGRDIFPGDFTATQTSGGAIDTFIESVAFTEITLNDIDGNEITTLNEPASVTLKLPDALQGDYTHGDTIPWWSYDEENAVWVREDADPATPELDDSLIVNVDGLLYAQAKVSHFSWWNVDKPITEHACMCAEVENEDSNPVEFVNVSANGVTYNAASSKRSTDNKGIACVTVKRSANSEDRETVKMQADYGGRKFNYNASDESEGETGSPVVKTPTEEGSMIIDNPGVCLVLKNRIKIAFDGVINGSVKDSSDNPKANFTFSTDMGEEITTNGSGQFSYKAPSGSPVTFFKAGLFSEIGMAPDTETPGQLDIVLPNSKPWLQKFKRSRKGNLDNNQTVSFSALAVDPEGEDLTYDWQIDGGFSLSVDEDTKGASFTTPASGGGAAMITLSITDAKGGVTVETQVLSWGESLGSSNTLNLLFLENNENNTAVSGVIAYLHDAGGNVINTVSSDENGFAYIGDVGASTATFSVLYKTSNMDCSTALTDYMQTFVNMPVGNIVYYLDSFVKAAPRSERTTLCSYSNVATYDVSLSNVDTVNPTGVKLMPKGAYIYPLSGTGTETFSTQTLNTSHLNDDGLFDMLAYAYAGNGSIWGYDYLVDQIVEQDGSYSYDLDLSRTAVDVPWSKPNSISGPKLYFMANRKGLSHTLFSSQSYNTSGNISAPSEFPADEYVVEFSKTTIPGYYGKQSYKSLPAFINIPEPVVGVDNGQFNSDTFSWTSSNNADMSFISMNLNCGVRGLTWNVWLSGDTTSWDMITPPTDISTCVGSIRDKIGGYNGVNSTDHYIAVYRHEMDILSNATDLYTLLVKGKLLENESSLSGYSVYRLKGTADAP